MKERPIPFSGPMIAALLREWRNPGTGKTQTRRMMNPQPFTEQAEDPASEAYAVMLTHSRYGSPGDRLWVREAWRTEYRYYHLKPSELPKDARIHYEIDGETPDWAGRYRHGRFMPRWASRITLEVVDVRVERLNSITPADARAEGVVVNCPLANDPVSAFHNLWESINGPGSWAENPWLWVVEFKVIDVKGQTR